VTYRSPARFLAPLALVAAFIAVYTVVKPLAGSDSDEPGVTTSQASSTAGTTTTSKKPTTKSGRRTYTVKSGDVLSAIAQDTGVSLERLVELNPDLDPQTLRAGQKIKLTR